MANVSDLAKAVGITVERLLEQFKEAGMDVTDPTQDISEEQKVNLLAFLRKSHGGKSTLSGKKVTLKRKSVSTLTVGKDARRGKKVSVEVRKKRTYVKQAEEEPEDDVIVEEAPAEPSKAKEAEKPKAIEVAKTSTAVPAAVEPSESEKPKTEESAEDHKARKAKAKEQAREAKAEREAGAGEKSSRKKLKKAKKVKGKQVAPIQVPTQHAFEKPTAPIVHEVQIPETITVGELAKRMSVKASEVIKTMMNLGAMATINQMIDQDTATIVVEEMGHIPKPLQENAMEAALVEQIEVEGESQTRPPVVTIMGHVDHGKTSLLDHIRTTRVAAGEAGGITQHIGAYHVNTPKGVVTFLDTPGHAAFTAMRARGAQVTDIVILIVAADDGVKPHTIEAITHAKAANVPIIVAINKMDKPEADADRVKNELSQYEIISEEWGGDTMMLPISAKTGQGIDELLDSILVIAEMHEYNAPATGPARGIVIESRLDKGRGPMATVLVQKGTLKKGDVMLAGLEYGRARAVLNETGSNVEAGPSIPVQVLGLSGVPRAGDEVLVVADEKKAREVALFRQGKFREVTLARKKQASLEGIFSNMESGDKGVGRLNIVMKADVQGSVEAITDALTKLSTDEVKVDIVAAGVGGITESDVHLAMASNAIMVGFNVRAESNAKKLIQQEGVELRYYSVIYELVDHVKQALSGLLAPEFKEEIVGVAEVREVFRSPKLGAIAGCMVIEGTVKRNNPIRVLRDNVVIYEGTLESLRRFREDVLEVKLGTECGIGVKNYNDIKPGDKIEVFETIEVKRTID